MKTLGQVAYEGWDSDVMTHTPWDEIAPGFQAAWQAAAEAVISHYLITETEAPLDFIKHRHEVRAVIEAAHTYCEMPFGTDVLRHSDLVCAIEALQEVE